MQRPAKPCTPVRSRPPPPHSDFPRRVAQLVRALPSHGRGHWFESTRAYQDTLLQLNARPGNLGRFLHSAAGIPFSCRCLRRLPALFWSSCCISLNKLVCVFDYLVLCGFPHIQMLSKRLLFVLKPVNIKVSILNLALSVSVA